MSKRMARMTMQYVRLTTENTTDDGTTLVLFDWINNRRVKLNLDRYQLLTLRKEVHGAMDLVADRLKERADHLWDFSTRMRSKP